MDTNEVRTMADADIVEMLVELKPADPALAWLAAVISDPVKVAGVNELAYRYDSSSSASLVPKGESGRHPNATSIRIQPDAFKAFFFRRGIPLSSVGGLFGRCSGWASVIATKKRIGFYAADELATELGLTVREFLSQVAAPEERERIAAF